MVSHWSERPAWPRLRRALGGALLPLAVGAAAPLRAQIVHEAGLQAVGTAAEQSAAVAGPFVAVRPSSRVRVSVGAAAGVSDGQAAWRGELLGHFLLSPTKRRGIGFYGASGVAVVGGPVERGYLVLALGAETGPAARTGWVVEGGIGGGARLVVGYRVRWTRPQGDE